MRTEDMNSKDESHEVMKNHFTQSTSDHKLVGEEEKSDQSIIEKEKKIKLHSEAFPVIEGEELQRPEQPENTNTINPIKKEKILRPKVESEVHLKLQSINFDSGNHKEPITIRDFKLEDLNELKKLQNEWFPLKYSDSFYNKIINKECYCIVAETKIISNKKEDLEKESYEQIIVGAAVFEITDSEGYVYKSWTESFMNLFSNIEDSVYIMTLGVIDEFRKKGVGKMLVDKIISIGRKYQNLKLISLHVISYNKAAIRFYEKMGFTTIETLHNFYYVGNKQYDGEFYGIFINNGKLNTGWSLKLRKFFQ